MFIVENSERIQYPGRGNECGGEIAWRCKIEEGDISGGGLLIGRADINAIHLYI